MGVRQQKRSHLINLLQEEKGDLINKFNAVNSVLQIMEPKQTEAMTGQQKELDFHNTINETGERLTELKQNAKTQQEKILQYFYQNSLYCFTPFDIQSKVLPFAPITSVRRAITNLTTQGHLVKDPQQKIEKYGVKNNHWAFNVKGPHGNKYQD